MDENEKFRDITQEDIKDGVIEWEKDSQCDDESNLKNENKLLSYAEWIRSIAQMFVAVPVIILIGMAILAGSSGLSWNFANALLVGGCVVAVIFVIAIPYFAFAYFMKVVAEISKTLKKIESEKNRKDNRDNG